MGVHVWLANRLQFSAPPWNTELAVAHLILRATIMQKTKLEAYAEILRASVTSYAYDCVTCDDFQTMLSRRHGSMLEVETRIREQLVSRDRETVKDGLSNVVFWGFASQGIQRRRVSTFRQNVKACQLDRFMKLVSGRPYVGLWDIKKLKLPQFSQMSLTSKLLTFLYPERYVVLDLKIARFGKAHDLPLQSNGIPVMRQLKFTYFKERSNAIPLTRSVNIPVYYNWAAWCGCIAARVNRSPSTSDREPLRPVDVERAIFSCLLGNADGLARFLLSGP